MAEIKTHEGHLNAEGRRFGIVAGRFNEFITARLIDGAEDCLLRHGCSPQDIEVYRVPGAFEVPLAAKRVAAAGQFDAVICLGTVIRAETPHFEFVAAQAAKGVLEVGLETAVPVIFGIVTTDTLEQAIDRSGARSGNRGADAALSAIEMVNLLQSGSQG